MHVYNTYTVTLVPGKRFAGIEHLKKMASWMENKFGVEAEVLGNMSGAVYDQHLVARFESLAALEEISAKMVADPEYLAWFSDAEGLINWKSARQSLYQVY